MAARTDWSWKPDEVTQKAIISGNNKVRRAARGSSTQASFQPVENDMATKKKATKKKVAAKKSAPRKKLDGKALAAKRKPRDSVAQFIKDELQAGRTDVDKIIEKAKAEFPKTNPTRGYVRWIAKGIGKSKQVAPEAGEKAAPKKAAGKKAAKKTKSAPASQPAAASSPAPVDPAS